MSRDWYGATMPTDPWSWGLDVSGMRGSPSNSQINAWPVPTTTETRKVVRRGITATSGRAQFASDGGMDLLNDQVNDLKYLSQNAITPLAESTGFTPQSAASPVSAVGHNSAQQHHYPASSSSDNHNTTAAAAIGSKRKEADDSPNAGGKQQRSKRNRYISIAW
jgi:hypothetical protein